MTKPSLSLSKGLLAFSGESFLVERAFIEVNPAMPNGVIHASVPPQIIASATPCCISLKASPIE
jgi:hypothetical protein